MKWQDLDAKAQRKVVILAVLIALALLILIWPTSAPVRRPPVRQKPSPMGNAGPVRVAPPRPVAAPDPMARLLGKWEGRESLGDRGICLLSLELRPGTDRQTYLGFSTFSCTGNALPGNSKDPVGLGAMMRRKMNYTSASFSGTAEGEGIALRATDNIGVEEAEQGCGMASMTLKPFGDNRMSVRWQETGKGVCTGGEMLLAHAR